VVGREDEQSLLLANDIVFNLSPTLIPAVATIERCPIHIDEQRVFADLISTEGNHHDWWALDTGATNHMTGSREIFVELDSHVTGTVKFGDGSIMKIEGRGSILLTCKNITYCTLTGVYYIPRLTPSIISVSQFDESGCHIAINKGILTSTTFPGTFSPRSCGIATSCTTSHCMWAAQCAWRCTPSRRCGYGMHISAISTSTRWGNLIARALFDGCPYLITLIMCV
jgi:hypothetical protein